MPTVTLTPGMSPPSYDVERHMGSESRELRTTIDPSMMISLGTFTGLTPEMILATVRMQVRQMDDQIKASLGAVENNRNEAAHLGAEILRFQELKNLMEEHDNMVDGGRADLTQINDHARSELRTMLGISDDADEGAATASFRGALDSRYGISVAAGEDHLEMSVIDRKIDDLTEQQRVINAGTEMTMMQLQSAMQMRTQILQLGSNMLSAQDQANDTIIGNLR